MEQQKVITLDDKNSIDILLQYIEVGQQKGAYLLQEAELLKRAVDVLKNNVPDAEINQSNAKNLLVQGIHKAQKHGSFTLNDAAILSKVVQYVQTIPSQAPTQITPITPTPVQHTITPTPTPVQQTNVEDLSELSEPVPLKPKEV